MDELLRAQAQSTYELRSDDALRSAAADPAVEPRSDPQETSSSKSPNAKRTSLKAPVVVPKPDSSRSASSANGALPEFILERNQLFDKLKKQHDAEILARDKVSITIMIEQGRNKDGQLRETKQLYGKAWQTTPGFLLRDVDKDVSADVVIAKVDGKELWDLDRPLERDCRISYLPFTSPEGKNVFWHSSAHVLGEAAECQYNCLLSHGPPVEQGFFYDMALPEGQGVKETDWPPLETKVNKFFKEKQPFERLHVSIDNLKKMFGYSKYKMYYIDNLLPPEGSTVYKCGTLVDLCLGPHIQNTGKIKTFQVMKNSSAYFRGDKNDDSLQRIYGVAFPDKKLMAEHKRFLEEAKERDHRKIGIDQELFFFDELSPGSVFMLPHGTIIFNAVQKLLRSEYHKRGYQEVQTPNMYDSELWKKSGHWQHYSEDMFVLDVEKRKWALKPMNCPGHCLIFGHRERSYRELPIRMADFGVLHRNEASGALHGMTRVRKFQQDDTHVFCTQDQITKEIEALFDFLKSVYGLFGFPFKLVLSTRPENYLGDIQTWDIAEAKLKEALDKFSDAGNGQWELNEGDGAFYGPKIDITISDALKRDFQCATIQLDFQLPQRFELEYMTDQAPARPKDGAEAVTNGEEPGPNMPKVPGPGRARPVMIHRAIIGSFERFMAILTEHFAGKWPFWLSPRQVLVIPVTVAVNGYCEEVQRMLRANKLLADIDLSGNTMQKKIRTGQLQQYNFIFVLGAQEREARSVNIRNRDDKATQAKGELVALDRVIAELKALKKERRLINKIGRG